MRNYFKDAQKYGPYIHYGVKARLKEELSGSKLGWVWWLLEPGAYLLIYLFVYRVVFRRDGEYLVGVIFLGVSLWRFFDVTVRSAASLVRRNRKLLSKIPLPSFVPLLVTMGTNGAKLLFSLAAAGGLLVFYRIRISFSMLQVFPVLGMLFLLTFGLSLLVMHGGVYFEDLENFLRPVLRLLFYASGVFYPVEETFGVAAGWLLGLNPVALAVNEARRALLYGQRIHWDAVGSWTLAGLLLSLLGLELTGRFGKRYMKSL